MILIRISSYCVLHRTEVIVWFFCDGWVVLAIILLLLLLLIFGWELDINRAWVIRLEIIASGKGFIIGTVFEMSLSKFRQSVFVITTVQWLKLHIAIYDHFNLLGSLINLIKVRYHVPRLWGWLFSRVGTLLVCNIGRITSFMISIISGLVKITDWLWIIKGYTFLALMMLITLIAVLSVKFYLVWRQNYSVVWFLWLL